MRVAPRLLAGYGHAMRLPDLPPRLRDLRPELVVLRPEVWSPARPSSQPSGA